jgi:hypothetical protein
MTQEGDLSYAAILGLSKGAEAEHYDLEARHRDRRETRSATYPRQSSNDRSVSPRPISRRERRRVASIQVGSSIALKKERMESSRAVDLSALGRPSTRQRGQKRTRAHYGPRRLPSPPSMPSRPIYTRESPHGTEYLEAVGLKPDKVRRPKAKTIRTEKLNERLRFKLKTPDGPVASAQKEADAQRSQKRAGDGRREQNSSSRNSSPRAGMMRTYMATPSRLDHGIGPSSLGVEEGDEVAGLVDSISAYHLNGNPGSLDRELNDENDTNVSRSLWIGSIPVSTTNISLDAIFGWYGNIESTRILTHKNCGFVNFENIENAIQARQALNGKEIFPGAGQVRIGYAKAPNNSASGTPGFNTTGPVVTGMPPGPGTPTPGGPMPQAHAMAYLGPAPQAHQNLLARQRQQILQAQRALQAQHGIPVSIPFVQDTIPAQLAQMRANTHARGDTETIPIEKSFVGLIIGGSGENLRRVESTVGARVQFMDGPESGGSTRHCKISGDRAARAAAKAEIYRIIDENGNGTRGSNQDYSRGQPKPPSSTNSKDGENSQIMVPDRTVGLIIGRGGETIRDLQERSGCHVNIVGENKSINGLRPVNLI